MATRLRLPLTLIFTLLFAMSLFFARSSLAATITLQATATSVALGQPTWVSGKVDGVSTQMTFAVNGIANGNAMVGTISSNGRYDAPAAFPGGADFVVISGIVPPATSQTGSLRLTLKTASGSTPPATTTPSSPTTPATPAAPTAPVPPVVLPPTDSATVAAARFLEQASFGPTPADIAVVKQIGPAAWINQQLALPATTIPPGVSSVDPLRRAWFTAMASAPDQLRQRMIFALSQIFVVSSDKNPYGTEIQPWLKTLSDNAFGNYDTLLREMTLNPAMGKYLDLGNSMLPMPNENYAREVMQLFTIGLTMLNQDGSEQRDAAGNPIPTYDQNRIADFSRALSGWTYTGPNATGRNWENMAGPLEPREAYHSRVAKTLLRGTVLPAGQTARQDMDGVMRNLFEHPNLPPFVAVRLIRAFVTSNPSPAYIRRVADVFAGSGSTPRGDLAATLRAVLLDPEARSDAPSATGGKLKDPILHTLGLVRALGGTVIDPTNLFWSYAGLGQRLAGAPSVFNFYSPLSRLPGNPQYFGPEFQIYGGAYAIQRANFVYGLLNSDNSNSIRVSISPFVTAAADPDTLVNLVDATLLQGRMSAATREAITASVRATADRRQRAVTALYLTAITGDYAVQK
jgi:uncharacterized protein (DUF1800 family)